MYCTGAEQLFTDIIAQTIMEKYSVLLETADKTFDIKMVGKNLVKLNIKSGESWQWNFATDCWDIMKVERPHHRNPYFPALRPFEWKELEASAMEQDGDAEIFKVPKPTRIRLDQLNLGVEPLRRSV